MTTASDILLVADFEAKVLLSTFQSHFKDGIVVLPTGLTQKSIDLKTYFSCKPLIRAEYHVI